MVDEVQPGEKLPEEAAEVPAAPDGNEEAKTEEVSAPADAQVVEEPQAAPQEEAKPETPAAEAPLSALNDCAACAGTGLQDERTLCPKCQGKGKVS